MKGVLGVTGRFVAGLIRGILLGLLFVYRYTLSPVLHMMAPGGGCRFEPTCSVYAQQAVHRHGPWRGGWLALRRLARCHPWGSFGYDPVPDSCSCTKGEDHQHPTLQHAGRRAAGPSPSEHSSP